MLLIKNPPFTNVVAGSTATLQLPIGMSFNKIILQMGGGLTKSTITSLKLRLNGKVIFEQTGAKLDLINNYRGLQQSGVSQFLVIDFTEPSAKNMLEEFIGNINTASGVSAFSLEIDIAAAATNPKIESWSEVGPPAALGVITKQLNFTASFGGAGKYPMRIFDLANRGAIIKRVHFAHTGGVASLEIKKNGVVIYDAVPNAVNEFYQKERGKRPIPNCFTYDPCVDDNFSNAINTQDMVSLDFNLELTKADTVTATIEVLDLLGNM